jgi:aminoglycoside phosphotransferase (APT) family kinase protein
VNDTIDIRPDEMLDVSRLEPYLRSRLLGAEGAFSLRQFGNGHANLTYLVCFADREYVLRRPPHGPLPRGSHDMQREYRVLSVLWRSFPLAPQAFMLCTDPSVIGTEFVLMERRRGIVIQNMLPPALASDAMARRRLSENFIDTLAGLHAVDYARLGLKSLGKPQGYLSRQLQGWMERWVAAETPVMEDADYLIKALIARVPASGAPSLVHNDFKLDNAIVDADDPSRLVAILDWDMCTLGDPLVDLGYVLSLWKEPDDPETTAVGIMPTDTVGFLSRAQLVERYARSTGRDCSRIAWYHAFSIFRLAVILQQIYARYVRGQTQDQRFRELNRSVSLMLRKGNRLVASGL